MTRRSALGGLAMIVALSVASLGLVVDPGNDAESTAAPSPDPGFYRTGAVVGGASAVYLQDGWVLTANHAVATSGVGQFLLGQNGAWTSYPANFGTGIQLANGSADLRMFRLAPPWPAIPAARIAIKTPALGTRIMLVAKGSGRGSSAQQATSGYPPFATYHGWSVDAAAGYKRWGMNTAGSKPGLFPGLLGGQWVFGALYDEGPTNEATGWSGDSGGGVFTTDGQLAGIIVTILPPPAGLPYTDNLGNPIAWYGSSTMFIDLSHYRDEICQHIEAAGGRCDWDGDAIPDALDKCILDSRNAVSACDTDQDGYGNPCDADFDQNFTTDSTDFRTYFVPAFRGGPAVRGEDMDCNQSVNSTDFKSFFVPKFRGALGGVIPGPSGLSCAGRPGCR